jgi:hypothetical protein
MSEKRLQKVEIKKTLVVKEKTADYRIFSLGSVFFLSTLGNWDE